MADGNQVPKESRTHKVPIFASKSLIARSQSFQSMPIMTKIPLMTLQISPVRDKKLRTCKCPHVLVADDDPFEIFYYNILFQKLKRGLDKENQNFRFETYSSGEDLLEMYSQIRSCPCKTSVLVVTDYNMGKDKINGIGVTIALRKYGFEGTIILRTSEEKKDLSNQHKDLETLLGTGILNYILEKGSLSEIKKTIQEILLNK